MKMNLTRKEWDLIIKALSKIEFTEEDCDKDIDTTDAGRAEVLAEKIDIEFCNTYKVIKEVL